MSSEFSGNFTMLRSFKHPKQRFENVVNDENINHGIIMRLLQESNDIHLLICNEAREGTSICFEAASPDQRGAVHCNYRCVLQFNDYTQACGLPWTTNCAVCVYAAEFQAMKYQQRMTPFPYPFLRCLIASNGRSCLIFIIILLEIEVSEEIT